MIRIIQSRRQPQALLGRQMLWGKRRCAQRPEPFAYTVRSPMLTPADGAIRWASRRSSTRCSRGRPHRAPMAKRGSKPLK